MMNAPPTPRVSVDWRDHRPGWVTLGGALIAMVAAAEGFWEFWRTDPLTPAARLTQAIPMAPSTAMLVLACAAALLVGRLARARRDVRAGIGVVGGVTAVVTIFVMGKAVWNAITDRAAPAEIPIGEMSPVTAALLLAIAMSFLSGPGGSGRLVRRLPSVVAALGTTFCTVIVLAYAARAPLFYGGSIVPVALPTAIALGGLFLGLAGAADAPNTIVQYVFGAEERELAGIWTQRDWRLLVVGLGVLIAAILAGGTWYLHSEQEKERRVLAGELAALAEFKRDQLLAWRDDQLRTAKLLTGARLLATNLPAAGRREDAALRELGEWMHHLRTTEGYSAVIVLDPALRTILAEPAATAPLPATLARARRILEGGDIVLRDYDDPVTGEIKLEMLVPVQAPGAASPSGLLVLRIEPAETIYPWLGSWPRPTASGEVLLVRQLSGEVAYLNRPRHADARTGVRRLSFAKAQLLAVRVIKGVRTLVIDAVDYRGMPVVGTGRDVPGTRWAVIAKLDQSEAYAAMRQHALTVILGMCGASGVMVIGAGLFWRQRRMEHLRVAFEAKRARDVLNERLALVTENANDVILMLTEDGRILEANRHASEVYGYTPEEIRARAIRDLRAPNTLEDLPDLLRRAATPQGAVFETAHVRKDGTVFPVEVNSRLIEVGGERYRFSVIRDISVRKQQEAQIDQLNRLYRGLGRINEAIVRSRTQADLFAAVCRALVETGVLKMAWIGWLDATTRQIVPVAEYGDAGGYLAAVRVEAGNRPEGRGPTGTAVQEGRVYVCDDFLDDPGTMPWRDLAARNGFRASIALPISSDGRVVGAITAYAPAPRVFGDQAVALCQEAAAAVSFGLEQLAAAERQRASDERLRTAFRTSPDAFVIVERSTGQIVEVNDRMIELYGYTREEMIGRSSVEMGMWVDPDARRRVLEELKARGRVENLEIHARRKNGETFWVLYSVSELNTGGASLYLGVIHDITATKAAEAGRRESDERLRAAFRTSPDAYIFAERETGRLVEGNDRMSELFGYSREEMTGRTALELGLWAEPEKREAILAELRAGGQVRDRELLARRKSGEVFPVLYSASLLQGAQAHLMFVVVQDITAQKAMEAARLKAEAARRELAAIVESSEDAIIGKTLDGVITSWNRGAEKLFGFSAAETIGRSVGIIFPPDRQTEEAFILDRVRRGETVDHFETVRVTKDRRAIAVSATISPLRDPGGRIVGASKIARDITDRKRAEAVNAARLHISQFAVTHTLDELLEETLNQAEKLTESRIGFFHFVEPDQQHLSLQNWSTRTKAEYCRAEGKGRHYPISQAGVWVECVAARRPVFHNDYATLPNRKGLPEGHAQLVRELVVPVMRRDKVQAILGVGNKPIDYDDKDAAALSQLADLAWEIADRQRAQEKLRASEERYRQIVETAREGICLFDLDWKVVFSNARFAEILGYAREEIVGRAIGDFVLPENLALHRARIERREAGTFEHAYRSKDGRLVWAIASIAPIVERETVVGALGMLTDVTALRESQRRITEQAELIDQANDAIIVVDLANRITFWNRGAENTYGWPAAEMLGRTIDELLQLTKAAARAETRQMLLGLCDWRGEVSGCNRSGAPIVVETRITVLRDAAGQPIGRLGISADITEQKRLEEQFLRAQRLESIGMLAAGIAHDLNNVLAPISMAVPLLQDTRASAAERRMLKTLESCAERGSGLVRQILGFAHGVGGEPQLVQIKHLLRDLMDVIVSTFPKSILLDETIPQDLWPVLANPTQVHQVLLNLCVNARDAMPHGGRLRLAAENRTLTAETAAAIPGARPGTWLVIQVEDTGTGIPAENLARIWEPFFTTKGIGKGTGLGLPTVRGIVETHRGFITVATELGRGTAFHVYLPAAEEPRGDAANTAGPRAAHGRGETILFVDDELSVRDTAELCLSRGGYAAVMAENGARGLEIFKARPDAFALVVTDLDMPIVDGPAFAGGVRQLRPDTKILAISGSEKHGTDESWRGFADEFLQKPFSFDGLMAAVERLLSARRGR